ncbi:Fur family transcriptional regulator [Conexibacter sp. JD483]|uniref:Fur family transcriptional regulator n=1 Tax=unclassified Conexibacter TaxID=2627773 RepID=UPI0027238CA5|nr:MULTISPECIES: Fur family transcriptional regulator [unclassified Conexibacter]MDO8188708.1 Fur family transcriptional regulator [Conexibacter sp. CPCC 205706]MDO8201574.1 Fur family transcriptional regulator [Conexibacter sp. CPCC 205762]MDR9371665.1 Fur family transcriptional regulator [Conexibacter sp. JD483]
MAGTREPGERDRWLDWAQGRLARTGLRAGAVRVALLELLARDGDCLISAQQIVARLAARGVGSQASVYRLLDQFVVLGLLRRVVGRDGLARYEKAHPGHSHYHLVDARTGAVEPFTDARLEAAIAGAAERHGFQLDRYDVVLHGVRVRGGAA